jgi:hypothetical protein
MRCRGESGTPAARTIESDPTPATAMVVCSTLRRSTDAGPFRPDGGLANFGRRD